MTMKNRLTQEHKAKLMPLKKVPAYMLAMLMTVQLVGQYISVVPLSANEMASQDQTETSEVIDEVDAQDELSTTTETMTDDVSEEITEDIETSSSNDTENNTQIATATTYSAQSAAQTKELYTKPDYSHLAKAGLKRGNTHDKQDLGLILPAGTTFEISLDNGQAFGRNLTLVMLNNDSKTEKQYLISSWKKLTVTVNHDSVPFIKSPTNHTIKPIVRYSATASKPLPVYEYNDGAARKAQFLALWESQKSYALIKGKSMDYFPTYADKAILESNKRDIDTLISEYDEVIAHYDKIAGLEDNPAESYNKNAKTKFFAKADISGIGAAYYGAEHIAISEATMMHWLKNVNSWGMLHEIAHGYQGSFMHASSKEDISVSEVWNNIYANDYQFTHMSRADYYKKSWLFGRDSFNEDAIAQQRWNQTFNWSAEGYEKRLYALAPLQTMTSDAGTGEALKTFNRAYRQLVNTGQLKEGTTLVDLMVRYFGEGLELNLIPYFESYGFTVSQSMKDEITNGMQWDVAMPIYDIVKHQATADTLATKLGKRNRNELVSTKKLAEHHTATKNIELSVQFADVSHTLVEGQEVSLVNGTKKYTTKVAAGNKVLFTNIPLGAYYIELPTLSMKKGEVSQLTQQKIIIRSDSAEKVSISYPKVTKSALNEQKIAFHGRHDKHYMSLFVKPQTSEVQLVKYNEETHEEYSGTYVGIKIQKANGEVIYQKNLLGKNNEQFNVSYPLAIGDSIEIESAESHKQKLCTTLLEECSNEMFTVGKGLQKTRFIVSPYGLHTDTVDPQVEYDNKLNKLVDYMNRKPGLGAGQSNTYSSLRVALLSAFDAITDITKWENLFVQHKALHLQGTGYYKDDVAPSEVAFHASNLSETSIALQWTQATDNLGVEAYQIYRDGALITTVPEGTFTYEDANLAVNTEYTYAVVAVDNSGNHSTQTQQPIRTLQTTDIVYYSDIPGLYERSTLTTQRNYVGKELNDQITRISLAPYSEVTLYESKDFQKKSLTYTNDSNTRKDIVLGDDFRHKTSSYKNGSSDKIAPSDVSFQFVDLSETTLKLQWEAATDNTGIASYKIYRDGKYIKTVNGTTLAYEDTGLTADTEYTYEVVAVDASNNRSARVMQAMKTLQATEILYLSDTPGLFIRTNNTESNVFVAPEINDQITKISVAPRSQVTVYVSRDYQRQAFTYVNEGDVRQVIELKDEFYKSVSSYQNSPYKG